MQIIVSSAGRFHAVFLARFLASRQLLKQFFSAGLLPADYAHFAKDQLKFNWLVNLADRAYVKLKVDRWIRPSVWYVGRDMLFDHWVKREITKLLPCNLFVGWANCSLETIKILKPLGVKTIIESGSMHIVEQEKILTQEYDHWGIVLPPIVDLNRNKMLAEYQLCDRIAVPSGHVAESFVRQGIKASRLIRVPYGIDFAKFGVLPKQLTGKFRALFVGQVSLQKGIMYLLDAWQKLKLPISQAELLIVGNIGAECKELIKQHFGSLLGVQFCGPKPQLEVAKLLQTADVLVLPSLQEGLAMVIGEAMASGTAVIASHLSGAVEFIEAGKQGFVVPAGDSQALAEKILFCFQNPELTIQMGKNAKLKAALWSWQDYATRLLQHYQQLTNSNLLEMPYADKFV